MVIAVTLKNNDKEESALRDNFIFQTFSRIIREQPQHTFIVISEKRVDNFIMYNNVINAVIGQQASHPAQWYIWYNIKVCSVIKKYKANVLISYGIGPSVIKVSQCLIVPDINFIYYPQALKKSQLLFYKALLQRCIKKSKLVITVSDFCKKNIADQYKINYDKIQVTYKGVEENFSELSYKKKQDIKEQYADGNEYFLYIGEVGAHKNLHNLFKAFSAFKKRQKSNMQLIIAGKQSWKYENVIEWLRLFKFKNEVKILKDISIEILKEITSAAYCFVYPNRYESFAAEVIQAMKSSVPVITSSSGALPEICAQAALYVDPENFKDIAVKMMLLFKDENLGTDLIEKGKIQAEKFSWDVTANLLWKNIAETFL